MLDTIKSWRFWIASAANFVIIATVLTFGLTSGWDGIFGFNPSYLIGGTNGWAALGVLAIILVSVAVTAGIVVGMVFAHLGGHYWLIYITIAIISVVLTLSIVFGWWNGINWGIALELWPALAALVGGVIVTILNFSLKKA